MRACVAYLLPPLAWGAPRRRPSCLSTPHEREGHKATVPVKRHRGTPGHHGTHGRTRAHGSHGRTSQPSTQTQRHTRTTARRPKPRPTHNSRKNSRRPGVDRSPRPTQKRPPPANPTLPPPAPRAPPRACKATGTVLVSSMLSHFFLSLTHSPFRREPVGLECAPLPLQRHSPQAPRGNSGACFLSPDCMQAGGGGHALRLA